MDQKKAYSIDELSKIGPIGRTKIYEAIHERKLVARKAGRRTIVLATDYDAFLNTLPQMGEEK
jgi:hypothetical protein